jgi:hypothetical protein
MKPRSKIFVPPMIPGGLSIDRIRKNIGGDTPMHEELAELMVKVRDSFMVHLIPDRAISHDDLRFILTLLNKNNNKKRLSTESLDRLEKIKQDIIEMDEVDIPANAPVKVGLYTWNKRIIEIVYELIG